MRHTVWALTLLLAGCSGEQAEFEPGQWQFSFRISEGHHAQPDFWGTSALCIGKSEAAQALVILLSQTALGKCTATRTDYANGTLTTDATCDMPGPSHKVLLKGAYTRTSFDIDLETGIEFNGAIRQMAGVLRARRLGECLNADPGNVS